MHHSIRPDLITRILRRSFPGRAILVRLYRTFLFAFLDPAAKFIYRTRIALRERSLSPFSLSDYQLLKKVRHHFPAPYLSRRWARCLCLGASPLRYTDLLEGIRQSKSRAQTGTWVLPETALLSPSLDCKAFTLLLSSVLNAVGIENELWVGLPANGSGGHAWVVVETCHGRVAVDQFNGRGTNEVLFLLNHPYAMTFKI